MFRKRNVLFVAAPLLLTLMLASAMPRLLTRFRPLRPHAVSCAPCLVSD